MKLVEQELNSNEILRSIFLDYSIIKIMRNLNDYQNGCIFEFFSFVDKGECDSFFVLFVFLDSINRNIVVMDVKKD